MPLELLLARADTGEPVLRQGFPEMALQGVPFAPLEPPERLWDTLADADVLSKQRWGLVIPEGLAGARLLELIQPLKQMREAEQGGAPARVYRVSPGMDGPSATRWKKQIFRNEDEDEAERPRYLLVLGDLDQVSLELQQALATDAYVGRLAFRSEEGYAAYVSKVLRWKAAATRDARARLLFYATRTDDATRRGYEGLIEPSLRACCKRQVAGDIQDLTGLTDELLERAAEPWPSVLLSLSHGLGPPWRSPEDQRERQGALLLPGGKHLTGADLASRPFLPGGVWFCFACFSAGTPARSTYTPWLRTLSTTSPDAAHVLASMPSRETERPFIAALPQAALANPEGPLAVMGHVDLAWSCGFNDQGRRTPSRFFEVLRALAQGRRAGSAFHNLLRFYNEMNMELTAYDSQEALVRDAGSAPSGNAASRAYLWLMRQDLLGYVLLGDPAVQLPIPVSPSED